MKKITLLLASFVASVAMNAQTITHNNSQTVDDGLGLTCQSGGITTDNQFFGVFDLAGDFGIAGDWQIDEVQFGVDEVLNAPGNSYPVLVTVYTTDSGDPNGTLTSLGSDVILLTDADALSVVSVPFTTPAVAPAGSVIVVELTVLDDGQTGFRLGATGTASNDDSWILADACGLASASTYGGIGFPDRWHIMNVVGQDILGVGDNVADLVSVFPNPTSDVLNVSIPSNVDVKSFALYDVLGRNTGLALVDGQINMSNLSRGVYILNVDTSAGTLTKKIVKE